MKKTVTWKYSIITPPPPSPKHSLTHQCPVKAPPHALSMIAPKLFDKMSPALPKPLSPLSLIICHVFVSPLILVRGRPKALTVYMSV